VQQDPACKFSQSYEHVEIDCRHWPCRSILEDRLDWLLVQIAIWLISFALTLYIFVLDRDPSLATRGGLTLVKYLTITSLLVLTFTTIWSYRYTVLAGRIADRDRRPSASIVRRTAGIGVGASVVGVVLSMLIMSFEVL